MKTRYEEVQSLLMSKQHVWLVTGCAGFIGSNLIEKLLFLNQKVVGLDNFSTGFRENIDDVRSIVGEERWQNFSFFEGDIQSLEICRKVTLGVDFVLHQAALGSVPRSVKDPISSHNSNVTGFLSILNASKENGVKRFVFASSSSVYGDNQDLPKVEDKIGTPLSPYAATKRMNEIYAEVFSKVYGIKTIGIRYFNVFGKRQNPNGEYAAVIPRWISAVVNGKAIEIFGDGKTSRDFCYIDNVVQMNLLAALREISGHNEIVNCACFHSTSLLELYRLICEAAGKKGLSPNFLDSRQGDILHSLASIKKAQEIFGYLVSDDISSGLLKTLSWWQIKKGS